MISVLVPRAGTCPHRERAWQWVRGQLGEYEVVEGWGDAEQWRKADAVADALSRASGDVLVIHDSDVYSRWLPVAIAAVECGAPWAMPHRKVRRLTEQGTTAWLAGERDELEVEELHTAKRGGGIVVLRRETYEQVPLDPRFAGWGQEDDSWAQALTTIAGERHQGADTLTHLWHPPQQRQNRTIGNEAGRRLRDRYRRAKSSPTQMRRLLDEVGTWRERSSSATSAASTRS